MADQKIDEAGLPLYAPGDYDFVRVIDRSSGASRNALAPEVTAAARALTLAFMQVVDAAYEEMEAVLAGLGYEPSVEYGPGVYLERTTQTVERDGYIFAPLAITIPFTTTGDWPSEQAKFRLVQAVTNTQLGSVSGAGLVGFKQAGAGSVPRTVEAKLRDVVSVKDFGAVGDGVADDTAAVHAAIDYAKTRSGRVFFPLGCYRVTQGYVQSTTYRDVALVGEGSNRENSGTPQRGSCILLDSTDPGSFFYRHAARHHLQVQGLILRCAQFVKDRSFFEFTSGGGFHNFRNCNFEGVEKPVVYKEGCYFQNAAFRDIQFRASGTIHSQAGGPGETNSLRGTMLILDNVSHETTVPDNSEKAVMDLTGVRCVRGFNVVLEGTGPGADWVALRLHNPYNVDFIAFPVAEFIGFHSEWSGGGRPQYCVEQISGMAIFSGASGFVSPEHKYRLRASARVVMRNISFAGSPYSIEEAIHVEDERCNIVLEECGLRVASLPQTSVVQAGVAFLSSDARRGQIGYSDTGPELLYAFDGGYPDAIVSLSGSTTYTPSKDAAYGRKIVIAPASATTMGMSVQVSSRGGFVAGGDYAIKLRVRAPTFSTGTFQIRAVAGGASVVAQTFTGSSSGAVLDVFIPFRPNSTYTEVGFQIAMAGTTDVSGSAEIYVAEIYRGANVTRGYRNVAPTRVVTRASEAPAAGEWERGDIVYSTAPSAAGSVGWACTAGGTPGTWKAFGAIAP